MADIKTYKKLENLGWDAFEKTGDINDYGMVVSAREKIKQLEQELQTPLFERIGHTVSLTNKGKELLQYAQKIYQLMEEMNTSSQKDSILQGNLRIGMADSLCHPIIVKNFANFKEQYPNISLTISTASTSELYKLLDESISSIKSNGSIPLPSDLLILRPCESRTKPWNKTVWNGALPICS